MIFLSVGHSPKHKGAHANGVWEHDLAKDWVLSLASALNARARSYQMVPLGELPAKVRWINERALNTDIAVEMHFDSSPRGVGSGSLTLYCPGSERGRRLALVVQDQLSVICPPSRGAREGWYRLDEPEHEDYPGDVEGDEVPLYFLHRTVCTALILEPEFIHNVETIERVRDAACAVIADALVQFIDDEVKRGGDE